MSGVGIPMEREKADAPEYLRPYDDWTYGDFLTEMRADGADEPRATRTAKMYAWAVGDYHFMSVPLREGWNFHPRPWFGDGGSVVFVTNRGRKHQAVTEKGEPIGPEQRDLAAMLAWLSARWVTL